MESAVRTIALRKVYPAPGPKRSKALPAGERRPDVVALDALDLEIRPSELFGLLGPNGAGKTTTLRIVTTRTLPTSGTAVVAGADVLKDDVLVRQRIGVVPQRANPDRLLNVRENLIFHAAYFGIPSKVAADRARELMERLQIAEKADAKPETLSGGQQQRLMIARALMHDPRVLILDEPTVGLDPQSRLGVWDLLRDLQRQGKTIVMSTHNLEEADRLADRLGIIDKGKLLAVDTPEALKARAPGGTLVELVLDGDASSAAELARTVPGVSRTEARQTILRAFSDRGGEVIPALIRAAEQGGRAVQNINLSPPSLETLFISLTGRKLD